MWGFPRAPDWTKRLASAKLGSKRRWNPTWRITPASLTAERAESIFERSSASGFSQKMCFPRGGRGPDDLRVGIGARADEDRVDFRVLQDIVVIGGMVGDPEFPGEAHGRLLDHGQELHPLDVAHQVIRVQPPDPPSPDES